jgi:pyridoxine kinase
MRLLSIQSHVVYGHVGNSAAVFPLERLGCEVWPIHTVQFSNHTGYGAWTGQVFDADAIRALVDGVAARGVLPFCDGVISGYLGTADLGVAVLEAVAKVRAAKPAARYCCDPVIGDDGRGIFVRADIPQFIRHQALPVADIVTPNHFELDYLAGRSTRTLKDARAAVASLHALGPKTVLVTSLQVEETPHDSIDLLASDRTGQYLLRTPKLPMSADGAGDVIAALFFFHLLEHNSAAEALSRSASSVFGLLKRTLEAGAREMQLVAAQEELVHPSRKFSVEKI